MGKQLMIEWKHSKFLPDKSFLQHIWERKFVRNEALSARSSTMWRSSFCHKKVMVAHVKAADSGDTTEEEITFL